MQCRAVRIRADSEYLIVVPDGPGCVLVLDARHDGGHIESIVFVNGDPSMENQYIALPMRNEPDRGRPHRHFIQRFAVATPVRSAEHTSELQSLMRISYAVYCLTKKTQYI